MQSSDKLTGSFCHSARFIAPMMPCNVNVQVRDVSRPIRLSKLLTFDQDVDVRQSRLERVAGPPVKWCRRVGESSPEACLSPLLSSRPNYWHDGSPVDVDGRRRPKIEAHSLYQASTTMIGTGRSSTVSLVQQAILVLMLGCRDHEGIAEH